MNTHWLVLSNDGWRAFYSEESATKVHCKNIELSLTSYLVRGQTIDASGLSLCYELI